MNESSAPHRPAQSLRKDSWAQVLITGTEASPTVCATQAWNPVRTEAGGQWPHSGADLKMGWEDSRKPPAPL